MSIFEQVTKDEETLARFLQEKTDGMFLLSCHPDFCEKFNNCSANPDNLTDCIKATVNFLKSEEIV